MKVRQGQRVGEMILLIAALVVYGGLLLHDRHPVPASPLPWGDQGSGMIAVEVTGSRGANGIYFLPEAAASAELSKIMGNDTPMAHAGLATARLSSAPAFTVSAEGGVLKATELSAVKRLALGLPIDLNRVTQEELLLVPGIGEKTAARIVQMRESRGDFERLQDLTAVPGIKERKLRDLEKYLTVGPAP